MAREALRLPEFRFYLGFRGMMTFGLQMQAVVIGYHLYAITKDPLSLGLIGLAEALPAITSALYAGHVADRSEKRRLLLTVASAMALLSLCIAWAHHAAEAGTLGPVSYQWAVYGFIFLGGIARGFYSPAGSSLQALLVPRAIYTEASAYSSMVWQAATVLGPTLGGFVYAWSGAIASQGVVFGCMALGIASLTQVAPRQPSTLALQAESVAESIRQGWRFVRGQRVLLGAISLDMLSVFFGGAVALLPIYAKDILHVGPEGLGMLRAADAVGSVATMFVITRTGAFKRPWQTLLWVVAGFGCTIIGFGLSTNFYLSLAWLVALGCFDAVSVVIRSTLIQSLTPDHMRGRVASISSIFIASSNEIGSFESGLTARWMGTVPATLFGGAMTLLVVSGFSFLKTKPQEDRAASSDACTYDEAAEAQAQEHQPPAAPGPA